MNFKIFLNFHQNLKLTEFKEVELTRMRIEEREKMRLEIQSYRQDLENAYKNRNSNLSLREQSVEDMLKQRRELEEREIFIQRQHLLDEMKQLRDKETEFKRSVESQTKFLQIDATKYEKLEEDLRKRESQLKQAQVDLETRLRDERERIKIDLERSFAQREFILQSIETKNKQDSSHIEIERAHLDRLKHEFQVQQFKINEIDLELQKATGESICMKQENELLKEKLSHCMDYDFILQENRMLKYKLELSKELIGEKNMSRRSARSSNYPPNYIPQRKRSVTFASEVQPGDNNQQIPMLNLRNSVDENSIMLATEMGADQLPKDENEIEDKSRLSYREEGDRVLEDALERSEIRDTLEHHNVVNDELRDLYEMQIYEQRKLYETINDVKKQVEFLHYGVKVEDEFIGRIKPDRSDVSSPSLGFIDSAKDRFKYLESESERVEQTYRDYQHRIKSKYYPINDDEEKEIRFVGKSKKDHNQLDVEKFLESTLKANLNAKLMRDELENEIEKYKSEKSVKEKMPDMKSIEEFIKSVPLSSQKLSQTLSQKQESASSIKAKLVKEENEFKMFQKNNYLDDDSTVTNNKANEDKDKTLDSELEHNFNPSPIKSPVKNIAPNEYVKMFESTPKPYNYEDDREDRNTSNRRIKIEYSDSSSVSSSSSESSSDGKKRVSIGNVKSDKSRNNEDDDEDFDW